MPNRYYVARKNPPDLLDHLAAHCAELIFALMTISRGITVTFETLNPQRPFHVMPLPTYLVLTIAALMVIGGIVWITAITREFHSVNSWYMLVRTALSLSGLGWLTYTISVFTLNPDRYTTGVTSTLSSILCVGLYLLTFHNEKRLRKDT